MKQKLNRTIVVPLTAREYDRLGRLAEMRERDPIQQARWLLRCGLWPLHTDRRDGPVPVDEPEDA